MSTQDIIRAWKDADYRAGLSDTQRAALPNNPAGPIELTDTDLSQATGSGEKSIAITQCCIYTTPVFPC